MQALGDPREAIASVGLSQKEVKAIANGNGTAEAKTKLRPLGEKVAEAKQWTRGRPLAATITAWPEQR